MATHLHGCPWEAVHQHSAFGHLAALVQQRLEHHVAHQAVRYELTALHQRTRALVCLLRDGIAAVLAVGVWARETHRVLAPGAG